MSRKRYPSDLTDKQWEIVAPLLPKAKSETSCGRKRTTDLREVLNAVLYWQRSGCAWHLLPHDFPPYQTVYSYFRKWQKQGVWHKIHDALREMVREQEGRNGSPTAAIMDSQSVKTTDVGGEERGFDGNKKVNGRKRHILVDTTGLLLIGIVQAANKADCTIGKILMMDAWLIYGSIKKIWADQGYKGAPLQKLAHHLGIELTITNRGKEQGFVLEPRRWVVERTFAWLGKQRRLSKDYERLPEVSEVLLYTAMIPLMLNRLTEVAQSSI